MIPLRKASESILQLLKNYYSAAAISGETEAYVSVYFPHLPFQIIWPTVEIDQYYFEARLPFRHVILMGKNVTNNQEQ